MLILDFINVGNGDSILVQEVEQGERRFSMLVDCGHDRLVRDDHPQELDRRSQRIYAGDFLKNAGISRLDLILLTHFHRDHVGGLDRVLAAAEADTLMASYVPPERTADLDPDGDNGLPGPGRNLLRCVNFYASALRDHPGRVRELVELPCLGRQTFRLTENLVMDVDCALPGVYRDQKAIYDGAFRGERNRDALMSWTKMMNVSSLRQRLHYRGTEIVLGGDAYGALWDRDTTAPCHILKLPHHASISSCTRKYLSQMQPRTIVVSVAAGRPDERPHPYIISLLREFTPDVRFTDAVDIPGLVEPVFHQAVHMEIP